MTIIFSSKISVFISIFNKRGTADMIPAGLAKSTVQSHVAGFPLKSGDAS